VKLRKDPKPSAVIEAFIAAALAHVGYTAEQLGKNKFGARVGYDAQPWAGAFIDVCAREAGLQIPSFVSTSSGLAEFIRQGNYSRVPKPGSIAVYNFASLTGYAGDAFSQPHCGLVTDVREFDQTGKFITVEGHTEGSTTHMKKDGVHQKVRNINDVLVFCHPDASGPRKSFREFLLRVLDGGRTKLDTDELKFIEEAARNPVELRIDKEIRPGDRNRKIETIQLALGTVTDLRGAQPGKWDQVTATACAKYQRMIGYVGKDATGLPDLNTLKRLGRDTGLFNVG